MKQFKIRASQLGKIMAGTVGLTEKQLDQMHGFQKRETESAAGVKGVKPLTANMQGKLQELEEKHDNPELPQTAKTYCEEWLIEQVYGVRQEISRKEMQKGLEVEDDAILYLARNRWKGAVKNQEHFDNDFMTGTPDIVAPELVDIKCPWTVYTFPVFDKGCPNSDYYYQLQAYMVLTGKEVSYLTYVLMDTPEELLDNEIARIGYRQDLTEEQRIAKEQNVRDLHKYSHLPFKQRVKTFEIKKQDGIEEEIKLRVNLCREYIDKIKDQV